MLSDAARQLADARETVDSHCAVCNRPIRGTRKRRYCSLACQRRAHLERLRLPGNLLEQVRVQGEQTRAAIAEKLNTSVADVSRLEREPAANLAGRRELVAAWAKACGLNPTDMEYQRLLLSTGNSPMVPTDEDVESLAVVAAELNRTGLRLFQSDLSSIGNAIRQLRRRATERAPESDTAHE